MVMVMVVGTVRVVKVWVVTKDVTGGSGRMIVDNKDATTVEVEVGAGRLRQLHAAETARVA